jgi:DNA-binding transcriptional regulator PaaX
MSQMRKVYRYKGVKTNILGLPIFDTDDRKKQTRKPTRHKYLHSFTRINVKSGCKDLLVIYDIPDNKKIVRDWFRRQLRSFDFIMIQKSVWVGPSPLPAEFVTYIKEIGLNTEFKSFKLAQPYTRQP